MPIDSDPALGEYHLYNKDFSYVVAAVKGKAPLLLHCGGPLKAGRPHSHLARTNFVDFTNIDGRSYRFECPVHGRGDYRNPAIAAVSSDGSTHLEPLVESVFFGPGKEALAGLPSTYIENKNEADTLVVTNKDTLSGLEIVQRYSIFKDFPAVARSMSITNHGKEKILLTCAMSMTLDLPNSDYDLITTGGAWGRERIPQRNPLHQGVQSIGSLRGASSHQTNPFVVLAKPEASERFGEALGLSLIYSGNFLIEAEVDQFSIVRLRAGIHPFQFSWTLAPGTSFTTPEAVLVYSANGIGGISEVFHKLYRTRLARGYWRDRARPILLNNWEGTYHNFTEAKLLDIARAGKATGIELFVMDDGWFKGRNNDKSSLGDWEADAQKLPHGLAGLSDSLKAMGMDFGIWMEPEMVSHNSEFFRAHPDWAIGVPGRSRTEWRNQYVLDLSRPEVAEHVYQSLERVFSSARISYLKWDMNRTITEAWSSGLDSTRQGEFFHRYILGVYSILARLTKKFPELLIEGCAGGGGRFDPGILAYCPQAWTSDNTDAIDRLKIQWGTSLCYPLSTMCAHISAVPNHQLGRVTPLDTRANVACFGVFGYQLDALAWTEEEIKAVTKQVIFYKEWREVFQFGRFYRLVSPFEKKRNDAAWMCVAEDGSRAVAAFYQILMPANSGPSRLQLHGLDSAARYDVRTWPTTKGRIEEDNSGEWGGDELLNAGLVLSHEEEYGKHRGDFWSVLFLITRK